LSIRKLNYKEKPCITCGHNFKPKTSIHRYCNDECKENFIGERRKPNYKPKPCVSCGENYKPTSPSSKCCDDCRNMRLKCSVCEKDFTGCFYEKKCFECKGKCKPRICENIECGEKFTPRDSRAKYCYSCLDTKHICQICGEPFTGRFWRVACSKHCARKLQWQDEDYRKTQSERMKVTVNKLWEMKNTRKQCLKK